ncbi:MAG: efflux RND transporter periplasmic adaptor subunit [Proteobacteria bacterium]|nr:efflux RND transporter periplasmic adaptor subunit [Pseudomonadota bacterium]
MNQTKSRAPRIALAATGMAIVALAAAGSGYWVGTQRTATSAAAPTQAARRILYWYDPMLPNERYPGPGKSSMNMDLIPRYADEASAGVRIDPGVAQNLGIRLAIVERASVAHAITAAGIIQFNGRNLAIVQARAGGFVERGHNRAIGDVVAAGASIVDIRVPEWTAAQAEYLAVRGADPEIAHAARNRLLMLGMPASLIARVEEEGAPRPVFTVTAPIAGAITALDAREGMTIAQGASLATISGFSPVWLIVSLPQSQAGAAQLGAHARASLAAYPGETFSGRIESVLPAADAATRTIEVRIALANPQRRLRPGMTAEVRLEARDAPPSLIVPMEAVIRTGTRTMVIVVTERGYAPTEIVLGRQSGDDVEVRWGLSEGQRVVASGQFLIDSEASLSGALQRLQDSSVGPDTAAGAMHDAAGRITALRAGSLTIAHEPVASLGWPAMSRQFGLARAELARGLHVGDRVAFRFRQDGDAFVIEEIAKTGVQP